MPQILVFMIFICLRTLIRGAKQDFIPGYFIASNVVIVIQSDYPIVEMWAKHKSPYIGEYLLVNGDRFRIATIVVCSSVSGIGCGISTGNERIKVNIL